jgi:hypothetical protein
MNKTVAFSAVMGSLLFWSCGGDDASPTSPTTTPTPTLVASAITLSVTSLSLDSVGGTSQLSATVKDQNGGTMASAAVTWATSDAAVATVSSSGLVTAISPGTANITAAHLTLSATASVVAKDAVAPEVTLITYDGFELTFQPGVLELYGPTEVGITVKDDHEIKGIAIYLQNDGVDLLLDSAGVADGTTEGTYTFTWNTHETTSVGGIDTLGVKVWDTSGNEGIGGQEIVLMHQPVVTVDNLLLQPVEVSFKDQDGIPYASWPGANKGSSYAGQTNTVAKSDVSANRWAFLSTDSVQMTWVVQRELLTGTAHYLGEEATGVFSARAPGAVTYEVNNVVGTKTYYYPQFTNSTTTEATPFHNPGLASGEINICQWNGIYRCSIAPGNQLKAFGYYELETTTNLIGYKELPNSVFVTGPYYYWTNEQVTSFIQTGTGAVSLGIAWAAGAAAVSGNFGESGESLPGSLIQKPTGPGPMRIPGAINDDLPPPRAGR